VGYIIPLHYEEEALGGRQNRWDSGHSDVIDWNEPLHSLGRGGKDNKYGICILCRGLTILEGYGVHDSCGDIGQAEGGVADVLLWRSVGLDARKLC